MNPTRRIFLQNAALSVIAASLTPAAFAQTLVTDKNPAFAPDNLALFDGVSSQTFEPWIGASFRVSLNKQPRGSLVLLSVNEMNTEATGTLGSPEIVTRIGRVPQSANGPMTTSFALHFQGSGTPLEQNTYTLSHDWLGTFPLLLVPSGLHGQRPTCTAVFNQLDQARPKKLG